MRTSHYFSVFVFGILSAIAARFIFYNDPRVQPAVLKLSPLPPFPSTSVHLNYSVSLASVFTRASFSDSKSSSASVSSSGSNAITFVVDDKFYAPEHFVFDIEKKFAYAGLGDGRLVKLEKRKRHAQDTQEVWHVTTLLYTASIDPIAFSKSKNGSLCDGSYETEPFCGRPLGLQFYPQQLLIADAYFGILTYQFSSKKLSSDFQSDPICSSEHLLFPNFFAQSSLSPSLIYLTDSSTIFRRRDAILSVLDGRCNGRLLSLDLSLHQCKILKTELCFPNGIIIIPKNRFEEILIMSDLLAARLLQFNTRLSRDFEGHLDGGAQIISSKIFYDNLPCLPDNLVYSPRSVVSTASKQTFQFWAGCSAVRAQPFSLLQSLSELPMLRKILLTLLPISTIIKASPNQGLALRFAFEVETIEKTEQGKTEKWVDHEIVQVQLDAAIVDANGTKGVAAVSGVYSLPWVQDSDELLLGSYHVAPGHSGITTVKIGN